jgi:hypothetical protein
VKSKEYGKEFYVARYITMEPTADYPDGKFDIDKLTIQLLRKLCKNVGIANCGLHNKFNCQKAIATFFRYQDILQKNGIKPTTHADRVTSNICRAVNVVFSEEFVEDFKTTIANHAKTMRPKILISRFGSMQQWHTISVRRMFQRNERKTVLPIQTILQHLPVRMIIMLVRPTAGWMILLTLITITPRKTCSIRLLSPKVMFIYRTYLPILQLTY